MQITSIEKQKFMSHTQEISIAWAIRVSLSQLGARLTAYISTKARLTTLSLAIRESSMKACRDLPEEIISMIGHEVREEEFRLQIESWTKMRNCLAYECDPWNHVSDDAISEAYCYVHDVGERELLDMFYDSASLQDHEKSVRRYCNDLVGSRLSRCIEVCRHRTHARRDHSEIFIYYLDFRPGLRYPPLHLDQKVLCGRPRLI